MVRLYCRHTLHMSCWRELDRSHQQSNTRVFCPCCAAPANPVAAWHYIPENTLLTQADAAGIQAANLLVPNSGGAEVLAGRPNDPDLAVNTSSYPTLSMIASDVRDWLQPPEREAHSGRRNVLYNHGRGSQWQAPEELQRVSSTADTWQCYHLEVRLNNGLQGLVVDCGALGNLGGKKWTTSVAREAMQNGRTPKQVLRDRPLKVAGVGNGSQQANYNCRMPIAIEDINGEIETGDFEFPVLESQGIDGDTGGEDVPGLLGLDSLENQLSIIDHVHNRLYRCGPGEFDLMTALPPGTKCHQLYKAATGHLILPITHYKKFDRKQASGNLTLDAQEVTLHSVVDPETGQAYPAPPNPPAVFPNFRSVRDWRRTIDTANSIDLEPRLNRRSRGATCYNCGHMDHFIPSPPGLAPTSPQ